MPPEAWYVPEGTPVQVNGDTKSDARPLGLADLRPQDRVTVSHVSSDEGRIVVRSITALRTLTLGGAVLTRNPQQGRMTIDTADAGGPAARRSFTVAPKVAVFINGKEQAGDVPLTIADLNPGDRVTITYDAVVHKIDGTRDVAMPSTRGC